MAAPPTATPASSPSPRSPAPRTWQPAVGRRRHSERFRRPFSHFIRDDPHEESVMRGAQMTNYTARGCAPPRGRREERAPRDPGRLRPRHRKTLSPGPGCCRDCARDTRTLSPRGWGAAAACKPHGRSVDPERGCRYERPRAPSAEGPGRRAPAPGAPAGGRGRCPRRCGWRARAAGSGRRTPSLPGPEAVVFGC